MKSFTTRVLSIVSALIMVALAVLPGSLVARADAGGSRRMVVIDMSTGVPEYRAVDVADDDIESFMAREESRPGVSVIEENVLRPTADAGDPLRPRQWALDEIHAEDSGADGSGVVVAVVDSGIVDHSDLAAVVTARKDFVGLPGARHHGTNVAGIIAARRHNGIGTAGIAPGVTLLDARVCTENVCPSSAVANGVVWAVANGADVINMSLGGGYSSAISSAVRYALDKGVVVVAAAGNSACSAFMSGSTGSDGPNRCLSSMTSDNYPARLAGVISVAAITSGLTRADYSSYGPSVSVGAPTDVLTTNNVQYGSFSGTSAASPHVAAVAAMVLQADPTLNPGDVKAIIQQSTRAYPVALRQRTWESCGDYDSTTGYWKNCTGLTDSAVTEHALGGAGFLDAASAVATARRFSTLDPAPSVVVSGDGLTVEVVAVSGADSYAVRVDNKILATSNVPGPVRVAGLLRGASYAVSVDAIGRASRVISSTRPGLARVGTGNLPTPVVTRLVNGTDSKVYVASGTMPSDGTNLDLVDASGSVVTECRWATSYFYCDGWHGDAGAYYTARFVDSDGMPGPGSNRFLSPQNPAIWLATPGLEVTHDGPRFQVKVGKVDGAQAYLLSFIGWTFVSGDGSVISTDAPDVACVDAGETVRCDFGGEYGREYQVRVFADDDGNRNSSPSSYGSEMISVVAEPPFSPSISNVRVLSRNIDFTEITWDTDVVRSTGIYESFDVFTSQGDGLGASFTNGRWTGRIRTSSFTPAVLDVTVVAVKWTHTSVGSWWLTTKDMGSASLAVSSPSAPEVGSCSHSSGVILCLLTASADASPWSTYSWNVTNGTGSVVASWESRASGWLVQSIGVLPIGTYTVQVSLASTFDFPRTSAASVTVFNVSPVVTTTTTTSTTTTSTTVSRTPTTSTSTTVVSTRASTTTVPAPTTTSTEPQAPVSITGGASSAPQNGTGVAPTTPTLPVLHARAESRRGTVRISVTNAPGACGRVTVTEKGRVLYRGTRRVITLNRRAPRRHVYVVAATGCTGVEVVRVTIR